MRYTKIRLLYPISSLTGVPAAIHHVGGPHVPDDGGRETAETICQAKREREKKHKSISQI